eukprot:946514-Lingulodinium_polyedra.AAC.1
MQLNCVRTSEQRVEGAHAEVHAQSWHPGPSVGPVSAVATLCFRENLQRVEDWRARLWFHITKRRRMTPL